jgi:ferredoxin
MLDGRPLSPHLVELARKAVAACPTAALRLVAESEPTR